MANDLSKLNVLSDGMVQTGPGTFLNSKFLSDAGYQQALSYQSSKDGVQKGEPSVLSSTAGRNSFESNVQPKINSANDALNQAKQNQQTQKETKTANESGIPSELLDEGMSEEDKINQKMLDNYDRQRENAQKVFDSLTLTRKANAQAQTQTLTNQWNERKTLLQESNRANLSTWNQQFIRTGGTEYAPGMTQDFLTNKEKEGQQKITELDNLYNSKIASINSALEANMYSDAAKLTQELDQIEEKALKVMQDQAKEAAKVNKQIRDKQIQASRDNAIAGLVQQGVTDPADIMNLLNEASQASGYGVSDFTAEEIGKTLKVLNPSSTLTGVSSDYRTYKYLVDNKDPSVEGLTYTQFLQAVSNAKRKPSGSDSSSLVNQILDGFTDPADLTATQRQQARDQLYAQGFSGDTAPQWFVEYLQEQTKTTLTPEAVKKQWVKYRDGIMKKFEVEDDDLDYGAGEDEDLSSDIEDDEEDVSLDDDEDLYED